MNHETEKEIGFKKLKTSGLNKKEKEVLVVDAPPGAGKTEAMIDYINSNKDKDVRFIYVTPFLTEIKRIIESCPNKNFIEPNDKNGSKKRNFLSLLKKNENIVCSHALFDNLDKDSFNVFKNKYNYVLIMDEVADVVKRFDGATYDEVETFLLSKRCHVDTNTFQLVWDHKGGVYSGMNKLKEKAELNSLYIYPVATAFWVFPYEIFKVFQKVFILTYKFTGQIQNAYYRFFGMNIKYIHINQIKNKKGCTEYKFEDEIYESPQRFDVQEYKDLINICMDNRLNAIGIEEKFEKSKKLSSNWYKKQFETKGNGQLKLLGLNCVNYYRAQVNCNSLDFMWTCFKDYKHIIQGHGMNKNFIPSNMRATNQYINKTTLAYLINCYVNPMLKKFFWQKGIYFNEDEYALSELLQWMFRSRIRKKEPINLYIPSQRMRELLMNWI